MVRFRVKMIYFEHFLAYQLWHHGSFVIHGKCAINRLNKHPPPRRPRHSVVPDLTAKSD